MSQTVDHNNDTELMKELEASIVDAEFKVLTESNQECATTESGLALLFKNWTNQ